MCANVNQMENCPFEMKYAHYPSNKVAQNSYIRTAATYYPSNTQSSYVNDRIDLLSNAQTPYIATNVHQHQQHQYQQQQHQQQSHTVNYNANEYTAAAQNMNSMMNYNNFNIPPNHQNHATTNHTYHLMDANIDSNNPNLNTSEILRSNTSEAFDAARELELSTEFEAQLSME